MKRFALNAIETSPFSLVSLAYQGGLRHHGIPGYEALIKAHRAQQISALKLVQSAIEANQLSENFLSNQQYLKAVENGFLFYYLSHPRSKKLLS